MTIMHSQTSDPVTGMLTVQAMYQFIIKYLQMLCLLEELVHLRALPEEPSHQLGDHRG